MPTRNIAGRVDDRHGIPLRHNLTYDLTADIEALETAVPATDDYVVGLVDGVLVLILIDDLPSGGSGTIFDILSGNAILTVSQPDLSAADVTLTVDETQIDHDALLNFVADQHIAHSTVTLTAGVGLSGGGDITASRTFDLDINELTEETALDEANDFLAFYDASAGAHRKLRPSNIDHDALLNFVANEHVDHSGVTLTAGEGLSGGGDITASRSFALDINELTEDTTPDEANDFLVTFDASAGNHKKVRPNNIQPQVTSVTGTLPIANGGTGQTAADEAFDALAPTTTQGDISYHDGTDNVRLPKGTAGQVLRMNAGATAPEWGSGGGSSTSQWTTVVKTVNTVIQSDDTVNDDADLRITTVANTNYMIRAMIVYTSPAAADWKYIWSHSGTTTDMIGTSWRISDGDTAIANVLGDTDPLTGENLQTTTDSELNMMFYHIFLRVGASGGTLIFRWAQNTSTAADTTLFAGSFLEYLAETP